MRTGLTCSGEMVSLVWPLFATGFALRGEALFSFLFRPAGRDTFSCLPKRKYPKRRAPGALIGWRRCPAFLANPGAHTTRQASLPQTGRAPDPGLSVVLGECRRVRGGSFLVCVFCFDLDPVGAAEHRSEDRIELAPCLSESSVARPRVAQAPVFTRSTGNPRQRASRRAAFLLDTFLWRSKEKYLAGRAKPADKKESTQPERATTRLILFLGMLNQRIRRMIMNGLKIL